MTPEQRRELERLFEEHRLAAMYRAARHAATGKDGQELAQRSMDTHRALMHYLDEITDYSAAEAVSGS